jgi:hypothetical protein
MQTQQRRAGSRTTAAASALPGAYVLPFSRDDGALPVLIVGAGSTCRIEYVGTAGGDFFAEMHNVVAQVRAARCGV